MGEVGEGVGGGGGEVGSKAHDAMGEPYIYKKKVD